MLEALLFGGLRRAPVRGADVPGPVADRSPVLKQRRTQTQQVRQGSALDLGCRKKRQAGEVSRAFQRGELYIYCCPCRQTHGGHEDVVGALLVAQEEAAVVNCFTEGVCLP